MNIQLDRLIRALEDINKTLADIERILENIEYQQHTIASKQ